jgi:UDP-N-acetylmuramoyl-L-alanyl-D-glutamate--2,6-diaminopimelate ligase
VITLAALLADVDVVEWTGPRDVAVRGVVCDSRRVRPGDVFFALAGAADDGRRFVGDALAAGASAVVGEDVQASPDVPVVRVRRARHALALCAARASGEPSRRLALVGITGTNGKTTTTHLLESIWHAAAARPGVIGTVEYRWQGVRRPAPHTTPDAPTLNGLLADMVGAGTTHVAMEVSSHALAQARVDGLHFDAVALTNVTRDHLDYHRDFDDYVAAKRRLFTEVLAASAKRSPVAVVNVDGAEGAAIAAAAAGRVVRVRRTGAADVTATDVVTMLAGSRGWLRLGGERVPFELPLVGDPHVENALLAAGIAWALGLSPDVIASGLARATPPPGRVEQIGGAGFTVVVDYAHSPDAIERLLASLRPMTRGRLITVFGCGGDRDRGKRPLMGRAAGTLSDLVVVTSDNPRTEDPERIIADVESGVRTSGLDPLATVENGARGYVVEADRRAAIRLAIARARPGDVVVVAGKGHEDYQIVGTTKRHFDDREEVRAALGALG